MTINKSTTKSRLDDLEKKMEMINNYLKLLSKQQANQGHSFLDYVSHCAACDSKEKE